MDQPVAHDGMDTTTFIAAGIALLALVFSVGAIAIANADKGSTVVSATAPLKASVVNVSVREFKFIPTTMTATAGPVQFRITNKGTVAHNLNIRGLGKSPDVEPGATLTWDAGVLEPGTYIVECAVTGHKDAGMTGTLTVAKDSGASRIGVVAVSDTVGSPTTEAPPTIDWKAIDVAHEKVVKDFLAGPPAATKGLGGQALQSKIENGVKVFELEAKVVQWEVAPGHVYEAWTYNATVPGPEIRMTQGETVKVRLTNHLPESTSIHFHGVEVDDNKQDGVTFVTQDPIKPGETYTYTLTPINSGSHMYHSHHAADAQVPLGLLGAFIVEPKDPASVPAFYAHDKEYTEILTDGPLGFGINGKGFPATAPIVANRGEKTLVRFMNEGLIIHPMHLHGHRMLVVAKDGNFLPAPYEADTLNVAPGERYDVIVTSIHPGVWAFHCHILTHAESDQGLHGMTTVWVVK